MTKIEKIINKICIYTEKLEYAKDELDKFFEPILAEFGIHKVYVETVHIGKVTVDISYRYWYRDCPHDECKTIPVEIINARDPVKAAKQYVEKLKADAEQKKIDADKKLLSELQQKIYNN